MTEATKPALSPAAEKFILHWGEMGTRWGVNRTVAQVHALLFLSKRPLNAEEISKTLSVARSNVSTSLRELLGWRIVRVAPVLGDRRQHFESMKDPWEMFRVILEERKKREFDPTIQVIRACLAESERSGPVDAHARERMTELLEFIVTTSELYEELRKLPPVATRRLLRARGKIRTLFRS
ncbi:MAG TPA: MarR family transcriptional regulator [Candidatus Acidoferrales bacterium]|nr:MarR family transcriptional regulator [Candidatus Acidoferrales bacterium]